MHCLSPHSLPSLHAPLLGQHLAFALQRTSETLQARTLGGDDQRLVDQVTLGVAAAEQLRLIADAPQPLDAARMVALDEGFDRRDSRSADLGGEACVVVSAPAGRRCASCNRSSRSSRPAQAKAIAAWKSLKA